MGVLRPWDDEIGGVVQRRKDPECVTTDLSRRLQRDCRVDDHPRMEHSQGGLEVVGANLKKGPGLPVEQGKGLIDTQLNRIGLDLREVGVHGAGERDVGRDPPGAGDARLYSFVDDLERAVRDIGAFFDPGARQCRNDLQVLTLLGAFEPDDLERLAEIGVFTPLTREESQVVAKNSASRLPGHPAMFCVNFQKMQFVSCHRLKA